MALHEITNDIKAQNAQTCTSNMKALVEEAKELFASAKIIISLGTPRGDGLQDKVTTVNAMLKDCYSGDDRVKLCHHENLQSNGIVKTGLYKKDKCHLNEVGTRILAANLRHAMEVGYTQRCQRYRNDNKTKYQNMTERNHIQHKRQQVYERNYYKDGEQRYPTTYGEGEYNMVGRDFDQGYGDNRRDSCRNYSHNSRVNKDFYHYHDEDTYDHYTQYY